MIRKIIKIDEEKCTGCGACAAACHEGAIGMVNGKAKLMREDYCDGLGDCLPACPANAVSFEEREAPAYDEAAVLKAKAEKNQSTAHQGCPGMQAKNIARSETSEDTPVNVSSKLSQWPVQIKLMPVKAPYYDSADLLIAADCTAYAYGNFHNDFIKNRVTVVGCPKLDGVDYSEKIGQIISGSDIKSITLVRMEVPCCGGLEIAARKAMQISGKNIPFQVVIISTDGKIIK